MKIFGGDRELRLYLLNMRVTGLIRMFYDHTRYAEFDNIMQRLYEGGTALTVDVLSGEVRRLLAKYRGPEFVTNDISGLGRLPGFRGSCGRAGTLALTDARSNLGAMGGVARIKSAS